MISVEKLREWIVEALIHDPVLGQNYVDWHTENYDECGVTITFGTENQFDIIIKRK